MIPKQRGLSGASSFVAVLVLIVSAGQVLQPLASLHRAVGYAGGLASDTFLGVGAGHYFLVGVGVAHALVPGFNKREGARTLLGSGYTVTEVEVGDVAAQSTFEASRSSATAPRRR